jgi:plastocyanin
MRRVTFAAVLAVAVLAAAGCGGDDNEAGGDTATETTQVTETGGGSGGEALKGSVGPGFEISLDKTEVTAGTYTLTVDDKSGSHNFHLTGPGVDVMTEVGEEGSNTFDVELQPGTYTFVCDPHSSSMNGTLTVT